MNKGQLRTALLVGLSAVATYGTIAGSREPIIEVLQDTWLAIILTEVHIGNQIVFTLSSGILVSIFFWFLIVAVPQTKRRRILKSNFQQHYLYFKEDVIRILLSASNEPYNQGDEEALKDVVAFRQYYQDDEKRRWYALLNGLERNPEKIDDLLVEMELLREEVGYLLHSMEIKNERVHAFFKRLSAHLYKLRNC